MKIEYEYCGTAVSVEAYCEDVEVNPKGFLEAVAQFVNVLSYYDIIDVKIQRGSVEYMFKEVK